MITVPTRLRLACAALVLSTVPLAAVEAVVATSAPAWRLPWRTIAWWSGFALATSGTLAVAFARGRRFPLPALGVLGALWILVTAWMAVRMGNPTLGFLTLAILVVLTLEYLWLKRETSRSFFDPRLAWYEGAPKPIAGLACRVGDGSGAELRVSRLDKEGVFVFGDARDEATQARLRELADADRVALTLTFRGAAVEGAGVPIRLVDRAGGAGIQFRGMSPDRAKELGDFVERLRGEGHV